jgi:hypothetical protein
MLPNSMAGSLSSFCMKWQCQCSLLSKLLSAARNPCWRAVEHSASSAVRRRHAVFTTSRIESVPNARCGDSREQAVVAVRGLDMAKR